MAKPVEFHNTEISTSFMGPLSAQPRFSTVPVRRPRGINRYDRVEEVDYPQLLDKKRFMSELLLTR